MLVTDITGADLDANDRDLSLPPNSIQAEQAVIASVLKSAESLNLVSGVLKAEDFYSQRNKLIYRAMIALATDRQPIDFHTLADRLSQDGTYEASGGLLYLSEINLTTPTAANIERYAAIITRTSVMRELITKAQSIAELAYRDDITSDLAIEKSTQLINSVSARRSGDTFRRIDDVLADYMDQLTAIQDGEGSRYGILSGYMDLDRILGGWQRTDLIILAARTSVGKTAFAMCLAVNAATKANATVGIFSVEMSVDQLAGRLLAMESGVDSARIRSASLNEQEVRKVDAALNQLARCDIWIEDSASISLAELTAKARRLSSEYKLDMIVVDYLQLVTASGERDRVSEIGAITKGLKALARELRVPIIALSQLSRAVEQRTPHIPMLSDLRESGAIEQDADVVVFLYRDEKYNPDTDKKGICDVIVAKHRNGPTGEVQLLFLERTTKFLDLEVYRS